MKLIKALGLLIGLCATSYGGVIAYFSTPQLQADFIAMATSHYQVSVTTNPYYNLTIKGKKPNVCGPQPCELDKDIALMVRTATCTYVYGWANGIEYEREKNLVSISNFLHNCTSGAYFGVSSTTWNPATCNVALGKVSTFIYEQSFDSPTVFGSVP